MCVAVDPRENLHCATDIVVNSMLESLLSATSALTQKYLRTSIVER